MTIQEIRGDLRDIRYYYSRKAAFDKAMNSVATNAAVQKAERYNLEVKNAPPRLYDLYNMLYVENNTQLSLAEQWGFCEGYIRNLNRQLYAFFLNAFAEKMKGGENHV